MKRLECEKVTNVSIYLFHNDSEKQIMTLFSSLLVTKFLTIMHFTPIFIIVFLFNIPVSFFLPGLELVRHIKKSTAITAESLEATS